MRVLYNDYCVNFHRLIPAGVIHEAIPYPSLSGLSCLLLPFLAMGMYRMMIIRPMAVISQGPIGNGQMLTASVAPGNTASWTFNETSGSYIMVFNADSPNAGTDFEPSIAILNPDGTTLTGFTAGTPGVRLVSFSTTQNGTYQAQVKNFQVNTFTGTANVNLNLEQPALQHRAGRCGRHHVFEHELQRHHRRE